MYLKLLFVFFLTIVSATEGLSQSKEGSINGFVVHASSGTPLYGVNIVIQGTNKGTSSNRNGAFRIDGISEASISLRASIIGFESLEKVVTVQPGLSSFLILELVPVALEIPEIIVERESIIGRSRVSEFSSSVHRVPHRHMEKFQFTDVGRALRSVPGLNIQEEDGYGLRPNVGIRGTGSERSSKISLMEDGVLTAPAPYAAPAAYYFPTLGRMSDIEIRKGSSQIKYGPYTTGGAINLLSTPIPASRQLSLKLSGGSNNGRLSHVKVGNSYRNAAFLVESFQNRSDGFKQLDYGGPTGFEKGDVLAKIRLNTGPQAAVYQAIVVKVLRTSETSNETYLGLTPTDFELQPFRRYVGSGRDEMNARFRQTTVRHLIQLSSDTRLTTTAYRSVFSRNWYKLDSVKPFDAPSVSISSLLTSPEKHPEAFQVISGGRNRPEDRISVKANNRHYLSQGLQSDVSTSFGFLRAKHRLELGARFHKDEMDRFQWVDRYSVFGGTLHEMENGAPGSDSNRIESAEALAFFLLDELEYGRLDLSPGIRFEHIVQTREDFGKSDPERTGVNRKLNTNTVSVWIPGMSGSYGLSESLRVFAGVHRGFAPPGSAAGTLPERSLNVETGLKLRRSLLLAEVAIFHNNYQNLLGSDLSASGGTGSGDQFNGGAARVRGIEVLFVHNLGNLIGWRYSVPISVTYTLTDAIFKSSFESEFEPWGTVKSGASLPYVSKHIGTLQTGLEANRFDIDVQIAFVGSMRTVASTGRIDRSQATERHIVIDIGTSYETKSGLKFFAGIQNVANTTYVAARRPAGLRPGLPRTLVAGMTINL